MCKWCNKQNVVCYIHALSAKLIEFKIEIIKCKKNMKQKLLFNQYFAKIFNEFSSQTIIVHRKYYKISLINKIDGKFVNI